MYKMLARPNKFSVSRYGCHEAEDWAGHLHFGHHDGGDWVGCCAKRVSEYLWSVFQSACTLIEEEEKIKKVIRFQLK
jgi:hypothetical protein